MAKETINYFMDNIYLYWQLWFDSFINNLAFSPYDEFVVWTMLHFGHNKFLVLTIAMSAFFIAAMTNYGFGYYARILIQKYNNNETAQLRYQTLSRNTAKISWLLLLATPLSLIGNFIIILHGYTKVRFEKTMLIILLVRFCYYITFYYIDLINVFSYFKS